MRIVDQPEVFLIAEPTINRQGMMEYLKKIGGESWAHRVTSSEPPAAELLVEFMGRLCYRSWEPGLNKNVTKVREDRGDYLLNVLRSGHGSVTEHATFSFVIHNASRVLTAELCRHRPGIAISEQSLRYVALDDLGFRVPPGVSGDTADCMIGAVEDIENAISKIYEHEGLYDKATFAEKKALTSAIRRIAPLGLATEIGWTANVRSIRHVIEMRSARFAEEEIRIFAGQVARIMQERCPLLFGDYEENDGEYTTEFRKV